MPRCPPKISRATSGFRCTAVIEQPEFWLTHHAALASILASSSITGTYCAGNNSAPPSELRQQHAQQPALDQRVDDRLRQSGARRRSRPRRRRGPGRSRAPAQYTRRRFRARPRTRFPAIAGLIPPPCAAPFVGRHPAAPGREGRDGKRQCNGKARPLSSRRANGGGTLSGELARPIRATPRQPHIRSQAGNPGEVARRQ